MLAVDWQNLGYAGTFVVGVLVGVIVTTRLAKVLAQFFADLRKRAEHDDEP